MPQSECIGSIPGYQKAEIVVQVGWEIDCAQQVRDECPVKLALQSLRKLRREACALQKLARLPMRQRVAADNCFNIMAIHDPQITLETRQCRRGNVKPLLKRCAA